MPIKFRGKVIFDPAGVQVGNDGPRIPEILCGSGTINCACLTAGSVVSGNLSVTGLTQAHKVFISASDWNPDVSMACIACSPGGGVLEINYQNTGSTTNASFVGGIAYLAILDK